jgi:hypothetical protein
MSTLDTIKVDVAKYGEPLLAALILVQSLTKIGGAQAEAALKAIDATIKTLVDGAAAGAEPADILRRIGVLEAGIISDRASSDAELAARFPSGEVA